METEAPVNLTYELSDAGGDETGHNALLTWKYPEPGDLQYGWITLVYELEYRRVSEEDNWKVGPGPRPLPRGRAPLPVTFCFFPPARRRRLCGSLTWSCSASPRGTTWSGSAAGQRTPRCGASGAPPCR